MACIQSGPTSTLFGTTTLSGTRLATTVSTETITTISTSVTTITSCVATATPTAAGDDDEEEEPGGCVSSLVITSTLTTPITTTVPRTVINTIDTRETQTNPTQTLFGCIRTADTEPDPPTPRPETPTPTPTPTPEPEPEPEISTSFPPPVVVTVTRTITSNGSTYFTKAESMSTPPPTLVPNDRNRGGEETPIGPIIGGVVGGLIGLIGIIALVWYLILRRRRNLGDLFDDGEDDVVGELKSDKPAKFGFAPFRRKKRFNLEDDDDLSSDRAQTPYEYGVVGARRPTTTGTHPLDSSIGTHSHTPSVGSNTYAPGHIRATSNTPLMSGQSPPASPTRTTTSIWTPSSTSNAPLWQPVGQTTPGQPPIWADPAAAGYFNAAAAGGAGGGAGGYNLGHGYGGQTGSVYYPPGAAPPVVPVAGMHPGSSSPPVHPQNIHSPPSHPPPGHPPPTHPPGMSRNPYHGVGGAPVGRRTSTHKPPLEQTLHGATRPLHPHQPAPDHTRDSTQLIDEPIPPELLIAAGLGDASSTSSTTRSGGRTVPRNEKSGGLGLVGSPPVSPVTPQTVNTGVVQVSRDNEPTDAPPAYTQV